MNKFIATLVIVIGTVFIVGLGALDIYNKNVPSEDKIAAYVFMTVSEKEIVSKNLNLKLKKFNRNWSDSNKKIAIDTLLAGEDEFNIDHRIVLSIMALESEMKIVVTNKNIDNTIDFGLTMQNSRYINIRYKAAEEILKRRNIKYSNSKYDIAKNIMSCYLYLNDIKKEYEYDFKRSIMAYNVGIRGAMMDSKQKKAEKYFVAFARHYNDFAY